jgi:hypothetical protein
MDVRPIAQQQTLDLNPTRISISHGSGIAVVFEFDGQHWVRKGLERGQLRTGPEPLQLIDVLAEINSSWEREQALRLDPKGAARLSSAALNARA